MGAILQHEDGKPVPSDVLGTLLLSVTMCHSPCQQGCGFALGLFLVYKGQGHLEEGPSVSGTDMSDNERMQNGANFYPRNSV